MLSFACWPKILPSPNHPRVRIPPMPQSSVAKRMRESKLAVLSGREGWLQHSAAPPDADHTYCSRVFGRFSASQYKSSMTRCAVCLHPSDNVCAIILSDTTVFGVCSSDIAWKQNQTKATKPKSCTFTHLFLHLDYRAERHTFYRSLQKRKRKWRERKKKPTLESAIDCGDVTPPVKPLSTTRDSYMTPATFII